MGVADNKTYKNMYHFTGKYYQNDPSKLPSLHNDNPKINDSINENPYVANVEIEEGEIVMNPDMSALFKAKGKKHSQGGTDVYLKGGSFVFSDHKSLNINDDEQELFDLKTGKKNTPAEVLKRNVDTKHYNALVQNLLDPKKDDLAKRSSSLMLDKYLEKIGQIGYLQEAKKGFPEGTPSFSENITPVNPKLKEEVMENKQYMRYGGRILPKFQWGSMGRFYDKKTVDPVPNSLLVNTLWGVRSYQLPYQPASTTVQTTNPVIPTTTPSTPKVSGVPEKQQSYGPIGPQMPAWWTSTTETTTKAPDLNVSNIKEEPNNFINIPWEFTPYQKESQMYNLLKAVSTKRYMPMRSRFNATYMNPSLLNPEQTVNDMRNAASGQIANLATMNPILANAQASNIYGSLLDKIPQVRNQYDNQNSQILNSSRQFNTQLRNQETSTNMQNDQNYYRESVTGQQNYDNMKNYLYDQAMNNRMRDVETNQTLAYEMASQKNPAWRFDYKTGQFLRNKKSILDVDSRTSSDQFSKLLNEMIGNYKSYDPKVQVAILSLLKSKLT
jgi:hypothetical protein